MTADQEIYYGHMFGEDSKPAKTTSSKADLGSFPNTKWQVLSVVPKPNTQFTAMYLAFQPDGSLVITTESADGKINTTFQKYSVVGESLLLSKPGSSTNVRFRVDGGTMHVDTGRASIVLEKIN
jgi:glucose/arabinose dehydrogenase